MSIDGPIRSHVDEPSTEKPTALDTPEKAPTHPFQSDRTSIKSASGDAVRDEGVFGGGNGENYRNMSRWDTYLALITNQFGLGIFSLPSCLKVLGVVPGLITILCMGLLSWWSGRLLHKFYCRHRHVANVVDMVHIVGGRPWAIVAGIGLVIQAGSTCANVMVTLSIALNTISEHALCTLAFIGITGIACWMLCIPRTARFIAQSGLPTALSIVVSVLIVIISLAVSKPSQAPADWSREIKVVGHPSFRDVFNEFLKILYAFAGHSSYVSFMAEMKDPEKDFPFALGALGFTVTSVYAILAIVIYCLAGQYTMSPALGSAPTLLAKIAYGIAIPAVLTTGLSNGHVGTKYIYVQVMRGIKATNRITDNSIKSWSAWGGCVTVYWILCFVLASAIPVFDSIISISSAATFAWFGYGLPAVFWLHLNRGRWFAGGWQMWAGLGIAVFFIAMALLANGAGLWSSITALLDIFADQESTVRGAFDCGDNSLF